MISDDKSAPSIEDQVLRRMLSTPPKPHKPEKESSPKRKVKPKKALDR
jgi:hypothetical protein